MRPPEEVKMAMVRQWLAKADQDMRACEALLAAKPPFLYPACFHAQQAAEKCLKEEKGSGTFLGLFAQGSGAGCHASGLFSGSMSRGFPGPRHASANSNIAEAWHPAANIALAFDMYANGLRAVCDGAAAKIAASNCTTKP
jgi:hypothetical protein